MYKDRPLPYRRPVQWHDTLAGLPISPPNSMQQWLTHAGCLSEALRTHCQQLTLTLVSWGKNTAFPDEADKLAIAPTASIMRREIFLCADDTPWTFGRLIVPEKTYARYAEKFDTLGDRLLGETLLHHNSTVVRSAFEYAQIGPCWGRRSLFFMQDYPILLTELFLPAIPDYAKTPG